MPKSQANQCIGISRGGRSTKIHAVVDALGNPVHIQLSCGNTSDVSIAQELLEQVPLQKGTTVLADRAYGARWLRKYIRERGARYCIPPRKSDREAWYCDWVQYKERHVVENFFLKIKEYRRIAMRYEKLARRYLTFILLASIRILLA